MIIQHNIMALGAYNELANNNAAVSRNLEKLSSGYRINKAGDDAAGLAISEKMRAQITGLERSQLNAKDGISVVQSAEGAMTEVHSMLNRLIELGTESANGIYQADDRGKIQSEVDQIVEEIDRISQATNFNGINLLDGSLGLNKDAVTIDRNKMLASGGDALVTADAVSFEAGTKAVAATTAQFSIDLDDLQFNDTVTAADTLVFTVDGKAITLTVGVAHTSGTTTSAIATGLATSNVTVTISGQAFTVGNVNNVITFTQVTAPTTSEAVINPGALGTSSIKFGGTVGTKTKGTNVHGVNAFRASAEQVDKKHAGIDLKINFAGLKDGGKLTISGTEFTFKIGKDSAITLGNNVVDLSKMTQAEVNAAVDGDAAATKINAAIVASDQDGVVGTGLTTAKISSANGKIHIDAADATNDNYETTDVADTFIKGLDLKGLADKVEGGFKFSLDATKMKSGDAVNIDGQTFQFVGEAGQAQIKGAIEIVVKGLTTTGSTAKVDDAADALVTEINANTGKSMTAFKAKYTTVSSLKDGKGTLLLNIPDGSKTKAPEVVGGGLTLQVGETNDAFNKVTVAVDDMSARGLGLDNLQVTSQGLGGESLATVKAAIEKVSINRGNLGALQNRLDHTISNLSTTTENMTAAESRIRDTDMAKEMMHFTKNNVLVQAAQSMLSQANQQPQQVLQLLR